MKKLMKKALVYLTTLAMCLSLSPVALAADGTDFQIDKSKTADVEVLDRDNPVTEVTLSLPSGEYQNKLDIVFAMDSSTSAEGGTAFTESVNNLFESILESNPNIELKVGVVRFRGRAFDALDYLSEGADKGLVPYSDDTEDLISKALNMTEKEVKDAFGNGSNTHAGLVVADEMLDADEGVDTANKYVILMTDGKSYIWYNEDNEPTTIYSQYYKWTRGVGPGVIQNSGKPALNQSAGYNKYSYSVDVSDDYDVFAFDKDHFEDLINSTDEELTGPNEWDQPCLYADDKNKVPDGEVEKVTVTNGADLFKTGERDYQYLWKFKPNEDWEGVKYLEANPYMVKENEDGSYSFDTETINPNYYQYHADALQKGVYTAANYWKGMLEKYKGHCAAITYLNGTDSAITNVAIPFNEWLRDVSPYGAEANKAEQIKALFKNIDNDIRYTLNSGVVTDEITEPFDLIMDGYGENHPFKLVVGENEFTGIAGEEDNTWLFGNQNEEGLFPYEVSWNGEKNTFEWTIHVPVENANPVQLSYKLKWNGKGEAGVKTPTNGSTLLEYTTTDGTDGEEEFESPEVLYPIQITYNANYTGGPADVIDRGEGDNYYKKDDNATLKGADLFTRSGYTLSGWSLSADGAATYQPGGIYEKLPGDVTLYAVWTQNQSGGGTPGGGGGRTPSVTIDPVEVPLAEIPEELNGADHFAYVEGYPDGTVKPEGNISRSETTTMLYRLLNPEWRDKCFTDQNAFSDVAKPQWFNKAVSSMAKGTYVEGYPDGTFKGNNSITRAEFVTIMVRFLDEQLTYNNPFTDIDDHWAKSYILKAVGAGWINGYPDGTFRPDQPITRVEAMKIINSVLHRGVDATSELGDYINFPDNSDPNKWYYYEVIEAVNNHEYVGERPSENWTRNAVDYFYDINKYERPEA